MNEPHDHPPVGETAAISARRAARCALVTIVAAAFALFTALPGHAETPFHRATVDASNVVPLHTSIAVGADGTVHIAYFDDTTDDLRYARGDENGWLLELVDATGDVGRHASLALDASGVPHIAYLDASQARLKYASRTGGAWSLAVPQNGVTSPISLAIDADDRAHIVFGVGNDLYYGVYVGAAWVIELVDTNTGNDVSLAVDSTGRPYVAYGNNEVRYAYRSTSGWQDEDVGVGEDPSLALDSRDRPRIAFADGATGNLVLASKASGDWLLETAYQGITSFISLALDAAGTPHVSFRATTPTFETFLAYTVEIDNVWRPEAVEVSGGVGLHGSLALSWRGYPVIAYPGIDGLRVADSRLAVLAPSGESWTVGAPAVVHWRGAGPVDVQLSGDGGVTYTTLAASIATFQVPVTVPELPSEAARIRVVATGDPRFYDDGDVFRIRTPHVPPKAAYLRTFAPTGTGGEGLGSPQTAVDLDGDGVRDVVTTAIAFDGYTGRVYIYLSGSGPDDVPDLVLTGEAQQDFFGYPVARAGDVNGDGFGDLVVGAPLNDAGGVDAGRAYLYLGGPVPDDTPDVVMTGFEAGSQFGLGAGAAGDVDGDGFDDLLVGAPSSDAGGANAGRAYLFRGRAIPDGIAEAVFTGQPGDELGTFVTGGDMNGDGFADVALGAPANGAGTPGRAYVYFGGVSADTAADLVLLGEGEGDRFGQSVALDGDTNGDGHADLVVGANQSSPDPGALYVFFGGGWPDAVPDVVMRGESGGDDFGLTVAYAGDLNDDGFADVVTGAPDSGAGGSQAGRVYVYYGGDGMDARADVVLTGDNGDKLGTWAGGAGDVTGDGIDDLLTGSNGHAGFDGRVELYDFARYHLVTAQGGESWNVGATESITWRGAERADIWLSVDGGASYRILRSNVGGEPINTLAFLVPHQPTRFARVRLTPTDPSVTGAAESDSLFTIDATIALLRLGAGASDPEGGVTVTWHTQPGPEALSGYRLERAPAAASAWETIVPLTGETSHHDATGTPGMRYRLTAVNGLGEAFVLGETSAPPLRLLAAHPLPYRTGTMTIRFATASGVWGGPGTARVELFDVTGRLVRTLAHGRYAAGVQDLRWDGRDEAGRAVGDGVYFLRSRAGGEDAKLKVTVLR